MRTENCACGGTITAPSLHQSGPYVEAHGRSVLHQMWRVRTLLFDPQRPTTVTVTVTCPGPSGASGAEGRG